MSRFLGHWDQPGHAYKASFDAFQILWRDHGIEDWLTGKQDAEGYFASLTESLGLPSNLVLDEARLGCKRWTLIDPETLPLVQAVRERGAKVVLATDNVDALEDWVLPAMGLDGAFDGVLNSARLGCTKGDCGEDGQSRFFGPYLDAEGIEAGESVLLDDSIALEPIVTSTGIRFLHTPFGTGPCAHLRALLSER